ncbi:MAG: nitrate reductase subunit beta [Gammaproteobacteria bacterium]
MDPRVQISMTFHLDKCIGCHTCSVACKNIWTDREGAEYMWWNNVETKPGTGYPTRWEDQERYKGGFEMHSEELKLKLQGRLGTLANLFFNPYLPTVDEYYEPFDYDYESLFTAPEGEDQPAVRAKSMITGQHMEIEAGPNWDDDLGGSPVYAENDPNLEHLSEAERRSLNEIQQMVFFYLPRICNHCANPGCVAACPAGAIYKRGEDGIVLIGQDKCRAWRMCISGCPYKKPYFNWKTGKSEKCILCYPRLESGQPPACFHACVGRIRYLGVLLYDADRIKSTATAPVEKLVDAQREMVLDPHDAAVITAARKNGVPEDIIGFAQHSPVYKFFKKWKIALPLHPEFRTLPMLFYVPPLQPVQATVMKECGVYEIEGAGQEGMVPQFDLILQKARVPIKYLASLFTAGNEEIIEEVMKKLVAVRMFKRQQTVGDITGEEVKKALAVAQMTTEEADAIFRLTALPTYEERFVVPPLKRDESIESTRDPLKQKREAGFTRFAGGQKEPARGW